MLKSFNDNIMAVLAALTVFGAYILFGGLVYRGDKEIVTLVIGILGTAMGTIVGYYFGSSQGSRDKDKRKDKRNEPPQ